MLLYVVAAAGAVLEGWLVKWLRFIAEMGRFTEDAAKCINVAQFWLLETQWTKNKQKSETELTATVLKKINKKFEKNAF